MANDPMQALQDAGVPLSTISDTERAVIAQLSPDEVQTLVSIRKKLSGGDDDTSGFTLSIPQSPQLGSIGGLQRGGLSLTPALGGEKVGVPRPGTGGVAIDGSVTGIILF